MVDLSREQQDAIIAWADRTPLILSVYLFGSRAKDTSRPDSDADLALVISDDAPAEAFIAWAEDWRIELREATGLLVDLQVMAGEVTPRVTKYVADSRVLLFRRS